MTYYDHLGFLCLVNCFLHLYQMWKGLPLNPLQRKLHTLELTLKHLLLPICPELTTMVVTWWIFWTLLSSFFSHTTTTSCTCIWLLSELSRTSLPVKKFIHYILPRDVKDGRDVFLCTYLNKNLTWFWPTTHTFDSSVISCIPCVQPINMNMEAAEAAF